MYQAKGVTGGAELSAPVADRFDRKDAPTGEGAARTAAMGRDLALAAADAAAAAFPAWSGAAPAFRAEVLEGAATALEARTAEMQDIAGRETGAAPGWTAFNIEIAAAMLRQAATLTDAVGEERRPGALPGQDYRLLRRPAGVVLGMAPWNASVTLAVRAVAAPLALGNTAVLKGSELCPMTHGLVSETLIGAGLPEGVLNFVTNAPEQAQEVAEALIGHPAVRRVNFTGSTRVGREVALIAAQHLKPCLLELSGKAAMIVLPDADVEAAARAAAHGAFFNQGQICMSTDRVIVVDALADAFVGALKAQAERLRSDDLWAGKGPLGRVIGPEAVARLRGLVDDAVARGAVLVTGGEAAGSGMQPTVLDHVSFGMRVHEEEVFGPVVSVIRVSDAEEAVTVTNDTEYGLAAAVIGPRAEAAKVARRIEAGVVHVNGSTVYDDPAMPFGGMKASGYGRFGGQAAIHEFTEVQWMTERDAPGPEVAL